MNKIKRNYQQEVYEVTQKIPPGRVSTYGAIADFLALGSARMVGWALNKSFSSETAVPAHRVVNRKGELSGRVHFPGETMMQDLLTQEGIQVEDFKVVDFKNHFWNPSEELL